MSIHYRDAVKREGFTFNVSAEDVETGGPLSTFDIVTNARRQGFVTIIKPSSSTDLHYRLSLKTCQTTRHRGAADGDQVFTAEQQERHDIVQRLSRLRQDHDGQFPDLSEEHVSVRVVQRTGEECEMFDPRPLRSSPPVLTFIQADRFNVGVVF